MNKYLRYKPFLLCVDSFHAPDNSFLRCINQCICTWCHCFRSMCVHMFVCVYAFFPKLDYIFLKGGGLSLTPFTSSGLLSQGLDMRWMMIILSILCFLSLFYQIPTTSFSQLCALHPLDDWPRGCRIFSITRLEHHLSLQGFSTSFPRFSTVKWAW